VTRIEIDPADADSVALWQSGVGTRVDGFADARPVLGSADAPSALYAYLGEHAVHARGVGMAHADIVPFPLGVRETAPASASKQRPVGLRGGGSGREVCAAPADGR